MGGCGGGRGGEARGCAGRWGGQGGRWSRSWAEEIFRYDRIADRAYRDYPGAVTELFLPWRGPIVLRSYIRRFGVLAYAALLAGGVVAVAWRPEPLLAQQTRCYIVVCTGNVCVWEEIKCPPPSVT